MAPLDPRLPGGGGYPIALQMVTAAAAAKGAQNYVTFEDDFGEERTNWWHGVDFTLNARLRQGLNFQVGTSTGRSNVNSCSADAVVDDSRAGGPLSAATQTTIKDLRNCRDVDPFQTTLRGLTSYTVPKVDVLVSATLRSQPAVERVATWQVPNTVIRDITGRLPPGGQRDRQHEHRDHRQRPSAVCRQSAHADRHAIREDLPVRLEARECWARPGQPAEHQLRDDV